MSAAWEAMQWAIDRETLILPDSGLILFDGAIPHPLLDSLPQDRVRVRQDWQPMAAQLRPKLWRGEPVAAALVFPLKQRDRSLGDLAEAAAAVQPGGLVALAAENDAGGARFGRDLTDLLGQTDHTSKHKARVTWGVKTPQFDGALVSAWQAAAAAQPILDGAALSRPGLFAWDRIDRGSALLAGCLPQGITGRVADFGCGWGYLAREVLARAGGKITLDLFDADARAVAMAEQNLAGQPVTAQWRDVRTGNFGPYDLILSNPPFHEGQATRIDLGQGFIQAALRALAPGGRLMLVANRNLPYERLMAEGLKDVTMLADEQGFKVLTGVRA